MCSDVVHVAQYKKQCWFKMLYITSTREITVFCYQLRNYCAYGLKKILLLCDCLCDHKPVSEAC